MKGSYIGTLRPARDLPRYVALYRAGTVPRGQARSRTGLEARRRQPRASSACAGAGDPAGAWSSTRRPSAREALGGARVDVAAGPGCSTWPVSGSIANIRARVDHGRGARGYAGVATRRRRALRACATRAAGERVRDRRQRLHDARKRDRWRARARTGFSSGVRPRAWPAGLFSRSPSSSRAASRCAAVDCGSPITVLQLVHARLDRVRRRPLRGLGAPSAAARRSASARASAAARRFIPSLRGGYFSPASILHLEHVLLRRQRAGGELAERARRVVGAVQVQHEGLVRAWASPRRRGSARGRRSCRPAVRSRKMMKRPSSSLDHVEAIRPAVELELHVARHRLVGDLVDHVHDRDLAAAGRRARTSRARGSGRPRRTRRGRRNCLRTSLSLSARRST